MTVRKHKTPPPGTLALCDTPEGAKATVVALPTGRRAHSRLVNIGLKVGSEIQVLRNSGWGPVLVGTGLTRLAIGHGMAERVTVEVAAEQEP